MSRESMDDLQSKVSQLQSLLDAKRRLLQKAELKASQPVGRKSIPTAPKSSLKSDSPPPPSLEPSTLQTLFTPITNDSALDGLFNNNSDDNNKNTASRLASIRLANKYDLVAFWSQSRLNLCLIQPTVKIVWSKHFNIRPMQLTTPFILFVTNTQDNQFALALVQPAKIEPSNEENQDRRLIGVDILAVYYFKLSLGGDGLQNPPASIVLLDMSTYPVVLAYDRPVEHTLLYALPLRDGDSETDWTIIVLSDQIDCCIFQLSLLENCHAQLTLTSRLKLPSRRYNLLTSCHSTPYILQLSDSFLCSNSALRIDVKTGNLKSMSIEQFALYQPLKWLASTTMNDGSAVAVDISTGDNDRPATSLICALVVPAEVTSKTQLQCMAKRAKMSSSTRLFVLRLDFMLHVLRIIFLSESPSSCERFLLLPVDYRRPTAIAVVKATTSSQSKIAFTCSILGRQLESGKMLFKPPLANASLELTKADTGAGLLCFAPRGSSSCPTRLILFRYNNDKQCFDLAST